MIRAVQNGLKYPPLRYNFKMPEVLIRRQKSKFNDVDYDVLMFKTDKSNSYSVMHCYKSNPFVNGKRQSYLLVGLLQSTPRKQGLGFKMLNYAKRLSEEIGCEGRFYLCADPQYTPNEAPHVFYRKFGMNTESEAVNKKLDLFIKEGKTATSKDFSRMCMYYPPILTSPKNEQSKKHTVWELLKGLFVK